MSTNGNGSVTGHDGDSRRLRRRRAWEVVAAVVIAASSAVGMMVVDAGTALAPEPVVTTQSMSGYNSWTADVVTGGGYATWRRYHRCRHCGPSVGARPNRTGSGYVGGLGHVHAK